MYRQWIEAWIAYITRKLKPERPILFWTKNVTEERQEQLLDYLKIQERQPNRYLCLTTAIYALRYLGYVRRACSLGDMRRWLSKRLVHDYTSKSASTQFSRAWNAHGRYTAAVQDELRRLAAFGVTSITA